MDIEDLQSDPVAFTSLIAHQLQAPIASVSQSLQAMLGEYTGPLTAEQRTALEKAQARCGQALTSTRRMLAIVRAQQQPTASPPAELEKVLRQVHSDYVGEAAKHDITLLMEMNVGPVLAGLGEEALTEVLVALVGNAMKYTPIHGRILLSADPGPDESLVRLSVCDSGIGVAEEDRERIFQPFFRTPAARDFARPGVGLGLAFVRSVVTAAGGRVSVGSSPLGGAAFLLELPARPAPGPEGVAGGRVPSLRVLVIGGVTAGPKAAAKIIRLRPDADVTVLDRGSVLSYAGCGLPHYVSGVVRDQRQLISSPAGVVRDPVFFRAMKNVHVRNRAEAVRIERSERRVLVRDLLTAREAWVSYDKLVLATGSSPAVPSELSLGPRNVFTLQGVRDAEGIKALLARDRATDVVIVGGGLIGIEITEALTAKGARVTVVEKKGRILPTLDPEISVLVQRHLEAHGVRIVTGTTARSFKGEQEVTEVSTTAGPYRADMVIMAIGVKPSVELARSCGLEIGETGALLVDERMATSDPDIFAAGDCVQSRHLLTGKPCYVPLGSTANRQARVAAVNLCGGDDRFPGVLGSWICKVFDYCVARTGLGEEEAREQGFEPVSALVPGPDRAHFMPQARLLLLKLVADRRTRRVLGGQATGPGAGDKRIDVVTMAVTAGLTVDELANADLCYAPPYAPAMDNVITAANVVRNKLDGHMQGRKPQDVHRMLGDGAPFVFLDVRTPTEYEQVHLRGSVLMPLGSLRGRLGELPRDRPIVVFSSLSLRGYEAALVLRAAGFDQVSVMEGGVAMWPYEKQG